MMRRYLILLLIALGITACKDMSHDKEVLESSSLSQIIIEEEIEAKIKEALGESLESYEFDIDIGDGIHKFRVVMEAEPFGEDVNDMNYDSELTIKVYNIEDLSIPVQELKNKTNGLLFFDNEILDANFDGYSDFCYVAIRGTSNSSSNFFLWDNERLCFKFSQELSNLSSPSFDSDFKVVCEFNKSGASSNYTRLYKYYEEKLNCVRALYMLPSNEEGIGVFTVEDLVEDEVVEVLSEKVTPENIDEIYDKYALWRNLEYTGE